MNNQITVKNIHYGSIGEEGGLPSKEFIGKKIYLIISKGKEYSPTLLS